MEFLPIKARDKKTMAYGKNILFYKLKTNIIHFRSMTIQADV